MHPGVFIKRRYGVGIEVQASLPIVPTQQAYFNKSTIEIAPIMLSPAGNLAVVLISLILVVAAICCYFKTRIHLFIRALIAYRQRMQLRRRRANAAVAENV